MDPFSLVSTQHLSRNHWPKERLIWNLQPNLERYGATQENTKVTHLPGRKFALLEGLIHDLKSVPDRFFMSILRGRCGTVNYHPVLKLIN